MPIRAWFPTFIYSEPLQKTGLARLNTELAKECRQLREFDAEQPHRGRQPVFRLHLEHHARIGSNRQPGVRRELLLELAGGPAGVAERHQDVRRTFAAADRFEDVLRCREAELVAEGERRLPVAERTVQHEAAVDLDRPAEHHRRFAQRLVAERHVDLLEQRRQRHLDRPVDDEAERALGVVLADVGQRMGEVRIRHAGHGDQEMMGEGDGGTHCGRHCNPRCAGRRFGLNSRSEAPNDADR